MFIAIKELKKEKLRYGMILTVIILISFLVYFLSSLAFGLSQLNRTAIDHWHADGVLMSETANNNLYSSVIDFESVKDFKSDNTEPVSITSTNASINNNKSKSLVFLGIDDMSSSVIPKILEGNEIDDDFELLISSNIRDAYEVSLGDTLKISDTKREFTIVGFTEDSNYNTLPVVYGKRKMVSNLMMNFDTSNHDANSAPTQSIPDRISFILIKDKELLELTSIPDELVFVDTEVLIDQLPGYKAQVLTFGLMIISLSIIVSLILGIFMYILTMQKKSIFAVLKIQGYQNSTIVSSIIIQILILVILGLSISLALNQLTISLLPPQVPVSVNYPLIVYVSTFILITSLLGAIFSAYSVLKIDPLEAL